jgi:gamma-glutamylaminecyclotransferase
MNSLVFVYGSLKEGFENHEILSDAEFIARTRTKRNDYHMVSLGKFPAVVKNGCYFIAGELYKVDPLTMAYLDMLEGNGELYERERVELITGQKAWMYLFLYDLKEDNNRIAVQDQVQSWTL